MSLNYLNQPTTYVIGSDITSGTLTNSYVDNVAQIAVGGMVEAILYIKYIPAEDNAILLIQWESGPTQSDVYKHMYTDLSTGVEKTDIKITQFPNSTSVVNGTTYKLRIPEPVADKELRVSFKETATSHGTIVVQVVTSGL